MENVITNDGIRCAAALSSLYHVIDPEIGLNVVDLGLIYQIDFDQPGKHLYARMTLTTQFCPMGESMVQNVMHTLANAFPDYDVHVDLTFAPPWNHERITEEGQAFLNR